MRKKTLMTPEKPTSPFQNLLDKGKSLFDDVKQTYMHSNLLRQEQCIYCGKTLNGPYFYDLYDHRICKSHPIHFCVSCSSFCDQQAVSVAEGKYLCKRCQQHHTTLKDAKEMVKMVREHYRSVGLGEIERFHLELVSVDAMRLMSGSGGDVLGMAFRNGQRYDIRVLKNLSHTAMVGILGHEILHIWQFQRGLNAPQRICEGFCDLGSFEIYSQIPTKHAQVKINMLQEDPSPIYGDGYRIVKRFFDKAGWTGVIKKMEGYKL